MYVIIPILELNFKFIAVYSLKIHITLILRVRKRYISDAKGNINPQSSGTKGSANTR